MLRKRDYLSFFIECDNCNQYACILGTGQYVCMYMHRYFNTYQYFCQDVVFITGIIISEHNDTQKFERGCFVNVTGCPSVKKGNFHGYEL